MNTIRKKVYPGGAAITATSRITNFNESHTPTINIYTDPSSKQVKLQHGYVSFKKQTKRSEVESQTTPDQIS